MNDRPVEDTFLTVAEVAERLRVNPQTVRNWIDRRQLPAVRVGRRVRIRQVDLDGFISSGETGQSGTSSPTSRDTELRTPVDSASSVALGPDARCSFFDGALELIGLLIGERSDDLAPALRTIARQANRWADALESSA